MKTINHIICTLKILTDLCFTKRKIKIKNDFVEVVYSVLVVKSINGVQSVKVEEGTIEFENYFEIYADFECNLRDAEVYEGSYTKKYHDHVPSFAYKIVCIDSKFNKPIVVYGGENATFIEVKMLMNLLKQLLRSINILKNILTKI